MKTPLAFRVRGWAVCGALAAAACTDGSQSTGPRQPAQLRQILRGEALKALDATDQFVLSAPNLAGTDQIDGETAKGLARGLLATNAPHGGLPSIDKADGPSVDQASLVPCRRTLYARSPWQPLEPAIARTPGGAVAQRTHGPYWLVPFCDAAGKLEMLISVSAYANDLSIEGGKIVFPAYGGEWFHWRSIPRGQRTELPVSPEEAALEAAVLTGARVIAAPELIAPRRSEGFPADARWHVRIDAAVEVNAANGRRVRTTDLFASWRPSRGAKSVEVPAQVQPESERVSYAENLGSSNPKEELRPGHVTLYRAPFAPIVFDELRSNGLTAR